ncbi:uncharacterized protein LACBIDRAFT_309740 [Laccaria bicolor S238N-H82]|uniref:Predicted protein n=1 Tax=Laccaria bicolor (strain S238N-H82 / ATCC MYA-4686) TaxID=486041 RepID=B0DSZ3_LACBS|nr:uncharacterized protein LACBIDRAFT_309740 [Laccaria bicolor S238N-H82]EDR02322.1 predicted protein [Laccaria bicolor S238N-H82]|eukprot:XP_001886999.1 predicted protein [Laccaria bicolor S238N-H82]
MLTLIFQGILLCALSLAYWHLVRRFAVKTALDNIPGPPCPSFFKGNFRQLFSTHGWEFHKEIAAKYGGVVKVKAVFGEKQLYVFDPKALHHILVKDQYVYEETSAFIQTNLVLFGKAVFCTLGDYHRRQRKMLNPVFSIAHMRGMVPVFYSITHKIRDAITKKVKNGPQEIDMASWMGRTALEMIGQGGFGYSFDTFEEDTTPNPYSESIKALLPGLLRIAFFRSYLSYMTNIGSPKFRRFVVDLLPWKNLHAVRDIVDTMHSASSEIFESKKRALLNGDEDVTRQFGQKRDVMSILMRANMDAAEEDKLEESELVAQVSGLTFAAMDTTSGALSRTLHLLAQHQEVQEKLRREVTEARAKAGDLTYDGLVSLPYLDAVCRESLRLYPPVSYLSRTTRQDIIMPLSKPLKGLNGEDVYEIPVPNNTNVIISIIGANRNPDIWGPNSMEWIPERWLAPLPPSISSAHIPGVYSHLMTFIGGGRACIGFKFAELEIKVVLSLLIESFHFSPSNKDIFWQMTSVATPSVVGEGGKLQLPLQVRKV